ncbi:MAG: nucleotidyltransferase family protein [Chloroflexi bacterium]|nr:nucleotidyltransferase family protein [Chloroflexota bacterium]
MLPSGQAPRPGSPSGAILAVARLLNGSWRSSIHPADVTPKSLGSMLPHLRVGGVGALAWRQIRETPLAGCGAGIELQQIHRSFSLQAALHRWQLEGISKVLSEAGRPAILWKGAAVAQFYPHPALRPFSDFDLLVAPGEAAVVRTALDAARENGSAIVDVNDDIPSLFPGSRTAARSSPYSWEQMLERSAPMQSGNDSLRIFCAEDHLRLLCLHFLKHGGSVPIWLCDIAAVIEARSPAFDWDRCLPKDERAVNWLLSVISLAGRLIGARPDGTPAESHTLPDWFPDAVLRNWQTLGPEPTVAPLFRSSVASLSMVGKAMRARWPEPVRSTFLTGAAIDGKPRWPLQARVFVRQAWLWIARVAAGREWAGEI